MTDFKKYCNLWLIYDYGILDEETLFELIVFSCELLENYIILRHVVNMQNVQHK